MRHVFANVLALATVTLASCATPRHSSTSLPSLEVSQVRPYEWEIIVRLRDESATGKSVSCRICRVLEDDGGTNSIEAKLADIRLARTDEQGKFIGIYSNGKEFPHRTKVVAIYQPSRYSQPVRASTTMYYH